MLYLIAYSSGKPCRIDMLAHDELPEALDALFDLMPDFSTWAPFPLCHDPEDLG